MPSMSLSTLSPRLLRASTGPVRRRATTLATENASATSRMPTGMIAVGGIGSRAAVNERALIRWIAEGVERGPSLLDQPSDSNTQRA